jgi:hypothetical protein
VITQRTGFLDKFERDQVQAYEKGDFVKSNEARQRYLATIHAMGYSTEEDYNRELLKRIDSEWLRLLKVRVIRSMRR